MPLSVIVSHPRVAQDQADADVKIACPALALWGANFGAVGKMSDMPKVWAEMADNLRAVPIEALATGSMLLESGRITTCGGTVV